MSENPSSPASAPPDPARSVDYIVIRRSHLTLALIPLAALVGLMVGFLIWGRDRPAPLSGSTAGTAIPTVQRFRVSVDDDPALGPERAPITIIEFSDFNCPYCRQFQAQTFQPLMDAYPDQIRFVYRDLPITSAESSVAAQAANCAGRQGQYWAFHDALFSGELGLGRAAYQSYAQRLGLDADALAVCIDGGSELAEVEADARDATALGVRGTPTFFINGIPLVGAQPLSQFRSVIDGELNS